MEAFSFLNYWRGSGGGGPAGRVIVDGCSEVPAPSSSSSCSSSASAKAFVASLTPRTFDTDDDDGGGDDGPFFDLEFSAPDDDGNGDDDCDVAEEVKDGDEVSSSDGDFCVMSDDESEMKRSLFPTKHEACEVSSSPSDDLFLKRRLVPIDRSSSLVFRESGPNSKSQFPAFLFRSATKVRVLMLKLRKPKSNASQKGEPNEPLVVSNRQQKQGEDREAEQANQTQGKLFAVKFKVEEVPIMSLFSRENSSKGNTNGASNPKPEELVSDDKRFSREMMQKYLKKVKPLYVRVSKRYGERLRFSGPLSLSGAVTKSRPSSPPSTMAEDQPRSEPTQDNNEVEQTEASGPLTVVNVKFLMPGTIQAGLRTVCKHLGKSRSASSTVLAATSSSRRDDSLLEQQDGIQSAILHCKKSFNASGGTAP